MTGKDVAARGMRMDTVGKRKTKKADGGWTERK
jgi:hypothetical protein